MTLYKEHLTEVHQIIVSRMRSNKKREVNETIQSLLDSDQQLTPEREALVVAKHLVPQLEHEVQQWKNNHDDQVRRKQAVQELYQQELKKTKAVSC